MSAYHLEPKSPRRGKPGTPVTNPALATRFALASFRATRVSLLTPYPPAASEQVAAYLGRHNIDLASYHCLNIADDRDIARVDTASILSAVEAVDHPDAEAVVVSCTALQAVSVVPELERSLGKPIITSNQASLWMIMRLAGMDHTVSKGGRLFQRLLSQSVPKFPES